MSYQQNIEQEEDITSFWRDYYIDNPRNSTVYKKRSVCLFLLLIVFVSFDSYSAECIYFDRTVLRDAGDYHIYLVDSPSGTVETPQTCSGHIVMSTYDFGVLSEKSASTDTEGLQKLLVTLFTFDPEIFGIIEGAFIIAFLTSYFTGRMVRTMGKHS